MSIAPGYPVRTWTDEQLDEHMRAASPHATLICQGCIQMKRREFERQAVADGFVIERLAEGWL